MRDGTGGVVGQADVLAPDCPTDQQVAVTRAEAASPLWDESLIVEDEARICSAFCFERLPP